MRITTILQRILKILGIFAITILLFACADVLDEINIGKQQDKATVSFSVTDNSSLTVLPQVSLADVARYKLLGGIDGEEETVLVESFTGTGTTVPLYPGIYNFTLNAYNNSNELILQGKIRSRQVSLTGTNQIIFSMSVLNIGTGKIQITLNFPTTAGITKISVNGDVASQDFTSISGGSFVYNKTGINAGDYFVSFKLYQGNILRRTVSELVLVRDNLTSSKTITLEGEDLKPLLTGTVSIPATVVVGQALTAGTAELNGTGVISYQWKRGAADIVGADTETYIVQAADVGSAITVVVTRDGYLGSVTSSATANVPALLIVTLNSVTADGNATQTTTILTLNFSGTITNLKLTADDITLTHSLDQVFVKGVPTVTGSNYFLPISGFVSDGTVTVAVSKPGYTINGSPKTADIYCYSLTLTGTISISGVFTVGQTLTAVTTNLGGNGAITYQWNRDGIAIPGATNSTYTVISADMGKNITLRVTRAGYAGYIDSPAMIPALTGTVSITGTTQVGQTLTANTNNLGGSGNISYQWKRGGTTNIGTNSNTYTLQAADAGSTISVTVTRSDNSGSVTSASTSAITLPALTGTVSITGTTKVGQTLTANTASLGGSGDISYQWKRGGTVISGETNSTYVLQFADAGSTISVTVTRAGNTGSITSLSTTVITLPTITETILPFSVTLSDRQITTANATHRYAVVLGQQGTLTLSLTSSGGTTALPNNGADVKWYNAGNTQLGTTTAVVFPYEESKTLAAGIYYIEIIGRTGSGNTGLYNIRVDYYTNEVEPNNTIANAQVLIYGLTVKGSITSSDTIDMFKYVLAEPGRFTVQAEFGSNGSNGLSRGNVKWYDANGNEIESSTYNYSYNGYMDLEIGTYYIGITPYYNGGTGIYTLRGDFTAAGNNEAEPNQTRQNAQSLAFAQTVNGFISYQDTIDMFKYVLTAPGRFTVQAEFGSNGSNGLSRGNVKWYDANGNEIESSTYNYSYNGYMDLEIGTYYIGITAYYNGSTGTYTLRGDFTAAGNNEAEPNQTRQNAQSLAFAQTVNGFISYQDTIDMFEYVLTAPGRFTVQAEFGSNGSNGLSRGNVKWYDANGNEIESSTYNYSYNGYMDLEIGTYYIGITAYYNGGTGTYTLRGDFTAAGNNEVEPNNTRQNAQLLTTSGQIVKGFISYQDDKDMYRIRLTSPGKLTVNVAFGNNGTTGLSRGNVKWYDANGNEVKSSTYNSSYNDSMDLSANTDYYIEITPYFSAGTGTYTLKVTW